MNTVEEKMTSLFVEERALEREKNILSHMVDNEDVKHLENLWGNDPRWSGITRPYSPEEMLNLRGTLKIWHTFAQAGAERLWHLLQTEDYIIALGAMTGNQAGAGVDAGVQAISLSG